LIETLAGVLADDNEVEPVKLAAVDGLAASEGNESIDVLCDAFEHHEELREPIVRALSRKTGQKQLEHLMGALKDAVPAVKQGICDAVRLMGETGEQAIADLLRADIASLRTQIAATLEDTGYIEANIRKLSHRDPAVRRTAAEVLSYIDSISAFRGIVLAARDPDQDVRVNVVRALERLDSKEGEGILKQLQEDPDRRVRKYTAWALERYKARAL
jgi:HEAT repeat protein